MPTPTTTDLIRRGYFPKELPNCFSVDSFGEAVDLHGTAIADGADGKWTRSLKYNSVRPGGTRRVLSIPNPLSQVWVCDAIESAWQEIEPILAGSSLAISSPTISADGRAVQASFTQAEIIKRRLRFRAEATYMLCTDVLDFYSSVYTHSIPWALHTKEIAKQRMRDQGLSGNVIDKRVQVSREEQTKGIDVGPDTSFVIGELLLSAVDAKFQEAVNGLGGFRFYDDYELYFDSQSQAEHALNELGRILAGFELNLNDRKTRISSMPQGIDHAWVSEIRQIEVRSIDAAHQKQDLVHLFELAFRLIQQDIGEHVMSYTMGKTAKVNIIDEAWATYEQLMWQAIQVEPDVLPKVLREIMRNWHRADRGLATRSLNRHISRHTHRGNSHEVAWALHGMCSLQLPVEPDVVTQANNMSDSIVGLLLMDAHFERGLIQGPLDSGRWEHCVDENSYWGEHWLFAYEAGIRGWTLGNRVAGTELPAEFELLKNQQVSFFRDILRDEEDDVDIEEEEDENVDEDEIEDDYVGWMWI